MVKALEKIKVLDFTRAFCGPTCTSILRDMGAEVIKVEIPGKGDATRSAVPQTDAGESATFIFLNRGKKSITLNMASDDGRQIVKDLVKRVDILVENFSPRVMKKHGLGYEELTKINPKLIYASVSGYGHTGPRASEPVYDIVAQAMGGLMSITGYPDGMPTKAGPPIGDLLGGYHTSIAILAALHYRSVTGEGQMIDISMQDCVFASTVAEIAGTYFLKNESPKRHGNHHPLNSPFGTFIAKDGYVVICCARLKFDHFLRVIGREDLVGDKRYAQPAGRVKNQHEVIAFVEEWTKNKTIEEILTILKNARIPCSPVPTYDEVVNDPQLLAREMIVEIEQPLSGKLKCVGSVYKMSKTPGGLKAPAPLIGEHNFEIFSGMLGYSDSEIRRLADEGII
jgi:CoA:oxalate CoA-transferase